MNPPGLGLGRIEQFDSRSRNFPVSAVLKPTAAPRNMRWACGVRLDQGSAPACVGFGWSHELAADPVPVAGQSNEVAMARYHLAQTLDDWPGENYAGTSVLAGAKACAQQGYIDEYRWSFSLDDLVLSVSNLGPAIIGIPWFSDMFNPINGVLHPTGSVVGGHCLLVDENVGDMFGLLNSWGDSWGKGGRAYISHADLWSLLQQGGDACIPVTRTDPSAPQPSSLLERFKENLDAGVYTMKATGQKGAFGGDVAFFYGAHGEQVDLSTGIEVF